MKKKVVRYKGKRHNLYFNDEGPQYLIPIDKDGKEVAGVKVEEFEATDVEELKMFDEDYVGTLREESRKVRETLEGLQKQFEGLDPEQLKEMAAQLQTAEDEKERVRQEAMKKEGKWQELMDQHKTAADAKLAEAYATRDAAVTELKNYRIATVLRDQVSQVENIVPGAVSQVVDLLTKYVQVQTDGSLKILDDDLSSSRLKPDSADPAGISDLVAGFMEKNLWFVRGSGAGAGSGGEGSGQGEGEPNPWKRETWNLTRQGVMHREDPAKAARMKAQAGIKSK